MIELLMSYHDNGTAHYTGLERIEGRVGGKSGSFIAQHSGVFENGTATTDWFIVPGSGTGELTNLRGEGRNVAEGHQEKYPVTFTYDFG